MNMQELLYKIKKPFRIINALINSAQTPEEFLIKGEAPPSIAKVRDFLTKYDLRQIIKPQLFNNRTNVFTHDGVHGFIIATKISNNHNKLMESLFSIEYPNDSTMSILFQHDSEGACHHYITITSKLPKRNNEQRNQKESLSNTAKKIIELFSSNSIECEILKPKQLIQIVNRMLQHHSGEEYDNSQFIYEQLMPSTNNNISNDGVLSIEDVKHKIFYTKQYSNITNSDEHSYLDKFINIADENEIDFYYCVNINLNPIDFAKQKVYEFHTTLVIKDNTTNDSLEKYIQSYFRYELDWYIYRNQLSPFQQFLDCIPFQFDNNSAELLSKSSITQCLPTSKLVQLFPMERHNEN